MLVNKNLISYDKLNNDAKNRIIMYTTARQFKNAVPMEEMLIFPSKLGNWTNYFKISLNGIDYSEFIKNYGVKDNSTINLNGIPLITARGDNVINKQIAFIVNKAFACELYLKLILLENNINFYDLRGKDRHLLYKLYSKLDNNFKTSLNSHMKSKGFNNIDEKINKISNAFIDWRYIFESYEKIASLDFLFLNEFCCYLDIEAKKVIYKNYEYNVTRDTL